MSSPIPSKKQEDLVIIYEMALGLERRFPKNNSIFSYGTRLCEEVGELAEVLNDIQNTSLTFQHKRHLIKESEDVLQIIQGVLGIYALNDHFPRQLESFFAARPPEPTKDGIITLSIFAGKLADSINHMEYQGVKEVKHGNKPDDRLILAAFQLTEIVAHFIQAYDALEEFRVQIQQDYAFLRKAGNIID